MIRLACSADLGVGPRERCRPLHGVITVRGLMDQGVILSLRGIAAPRILDDHDVASRHKVTDVIQRCCRGLIIRHPHENHREWAGGIRAMGVGIERDPISHPRRKITFDHDVILRLIHGWMFGHRLDSSYYAELSHKDRGLSGRLFAAYHVILSYSFPRSSARSPRDCF